MFQRTPSSIDVRNNHEIDPDWFRELKPGWQAEVVDELHHAADRRVRRRGPGDRTAGPTSASASATRWSSSGKQFTRETFIKAYEDSDDEKMTEIRARVDALVADAATAEALKPWYRQLCKRPCFHDEYLDAYNEPGTHLVDTDGKGVERIDETGVWANGEHYELDCIIYASGFEVGTELARRAGFETIGRDGVTLTRTVGRRHAEPARHPRARLPEPVHGHAGPGGEPDLERAAQLPRGGRSRSRRSSPCARRRRRGAEVTVEVTAEAEQAWVERLEAGARPG